MDLLLFMIAMIGIAVSIANKKRSAEARKKAQSSGSVPVRPQQNRSTPSNAPATAKSTTLSKKPSAPGTSKWPWPEQNTAQPQKKVANSTYGGTPKYTHVVMSTLEGGHTHTESSMTGEESCPPPKAVAQKKPEAEKSPTANTGELLNLQAKGMLQGVLYAEILGKPKALQRK